MKFIKLFTLLLGSTMFCACSENESTTLVADGETVAVPVTIEAPVAIAQRGGVAGTDSQYGGIANVDFTKYDIRYIIEIYDAEGTKLAKNRIVRVYDDASSSFSEEVILTRNRTYKFVAWADFVADGSTAETVQDLHYNTTNMAAVTIKADSYKINDESRDAFTGFVGYTANGSALSMSLTRPLGKVRVVTTDADKLSFGQTISSVAVTYAEGVTVPAGYNCLTGKPLTDKITLGTLSASLYGYTAETAADVKTVFTDYIFADAINASVAKFTLKAFDATGAEITSYSFETDTPVKANARTTFKGGVFTTSSSVTISIADAFDTAAATEVTIPAE
ncbi:MAG: hypothetical protein IJY36_02020 [Coprobacter sp.]|nr:hypothetical protein [Coprobacter sp.]